MIPLRYQVGLTASLTLRLNALAELGLIDEYEFVVQPQAGGPRADVVRGAIEACRLEAREPAGVRLGGSGDAVRAEKVAIEVASPSRAASWSPGSRLLRAPPQRFPSAAAHNNALAWRTSRAG